jgi:ribosome maturation factor RimP
MYKQNPILVKLVEPVISAMGYEMWGIEYFARGHGSLVRVFIDSESGITLDDCERVSRQVTGMLDVHDPIAGSYRLEISSPGLDRPLFTLEQFKRFQGHKVQIRLRSKVADRRNFSGEIGAVEAGSIVLHDRDEIVTIPADMIEKAHLAA